ncbi:MAG: glycoside hydrolase family 127 protein, partial [Pedobacter sp.]
QVRVNGKAETQKLVTSSYAEVNRIWKKGDVIEISLPMDANLIEANPLVEENRNQVAVKRGPIVYCLESSDMPGQSIFNAFIPASTVFTPKAVTIDGATMMSLQGTAKMIEPKTWANVLYRPVSTTSTTIPITLIPYYAWGNRGHSEMSVWLPLSR